MFTLSHTHTQTTQNQSERADAAITFLERTTNTTNLMRAPPKSVFLLRQSNRTYLMSPIFILRKANIKLLDYYEY